MIITIYSSRVYYNDLSDNDVKMIHHDIRLYHSMKNHAYNVLYNNFHSITNDSITSTELKKMYGTNDYTSLSAISEAKGVFKSNVTRNEKTIKNRISTSKKIPKMKWKKKDPDVCIYDGVQMNLYLFEVRVLKPKIKATRTRIKLLENKARNLRFGINKRIDTMPRSHFKQNNYIKITGRAQGRYCNNLFK